MYNIFFQDCEETCFHLTLPRPHRIYILDYSVSNTYLYLELIFNSYQFQEEINLIYFEKQCLHFIIKYEFGAINHFSCSKVVFMKKFFLKTIQFWSFQAFFKKVKAKRQFF